MRKAPATKESWLIETRSGAIVCERCSLADSPLRRLKGLLGRSGLDGGEGLLIRPTSAVHTWFMRFPIDVVFLDRGLCAVRIVPTLAPWRAVADWRAKAVLELAAGECERRGLDTGDCLRFSDAR